MDYLTRRPYGALWPSAVRFSTAAAYPNKGAHVSQTVGPGDAQGFLGALGCSGASTVDHEHLQRIALSILAAPDTPNRTPRAWLRLSRWPTYESHSKRPQTA